MGVGPKLYDELPLYLAGWDVALLPFASRGAGRDFTWAMERYARMGE